MAHRRHQRRCALGKQGARGRHPRATDRHHGGQTAHGSATSAVLTALYAPEVTADEVTLGPDALTVTLATDYAGGTTTATITSVQGTDGTEYLAAPVTVSGTGSTIEGSIPIGMLADVPDPDEVSTLVVTCAVGTDQYSPRGSQQSTTAGHRP